MWPYSASDNVDRARNSEPDKMSFNLCMSFVDYPWRFVTVPGAEVQLRLYQNMAHGGPPAIAMVGSMDQEDRQALLAKKARRAPGADQLDAEFLVQRARKIRQAGFVGDRQQCAFDGNQI